MALYRYSGSLLVRGGQLAIAEACCCLANCCDSLPETTYAIIENLSGCAGRDDVVTLTKTTDMSGTYWYGVSEVDCEPWLEMKFYCRQGSLAPEDPPEEGFTVELSTEAPYALPGCENAGGLQIGPEGFPADPANPSFDCLPIYWTFTQCEDLWEDSCCEEGGSFRITWQTTAPP